jgi:hypothetical protein
MRATLGAVLLLSACEPGQVMSPNPSNSTGGGGNASGGQGGGVASAGGGQGTAGGPGGGVSSTGTGGGQTASVTWYRDVLPIAQTHCQGCHVSGGIAPFALQQYDDAHLRAASLAAEVSARLMPPWMPSADCGSFEGARVLSQQEIDTFTVWAAAGAPAGDPADAPPAPPAPMPFMADQVVDPGVDYTPQPPAGRFDDYHCFVLDLHASQDRYISAYEVVPGIAHEVHHVALFDVAMSDAMALDAAEAGPGYTCFGGSGANGPVLGSWVPGSPPTVHPDGTAVRVSAGHALVMQVHYNTQNGAVVPDRTSVQLRFASGTPRLAAVAGIADTGFSIPPMADGYSYTVNGSLPEGVRIWGVQPHMHLLGRSIRVELIDSGGGVTCLNNVPAWQFHWQQMYFFGSPASVTVPAGATVRVTCTWDNPGAQPVGYGEGTSDEMCGAGLYVSQ